MDTVGEIKEKTELLITEWPINNFCSLSTGDEDYYFSPVFSFVNESWRLVICPNGSKRCNSKGYIGLYLKRVSSVSPITIEYILGIKTVDGKIENERHVTYTFEEGTPIFGFHQLISRSKVLERKSDFLPSNTLTLICKIKNPKLNEIQNEELVAESSKVLRVNKLVHDMKELFLKKIFCDVVIQVKDQQFQAHRSILAARSPVFESTFRNDMKEKETGTVNIEDCDPSSFSDFLCFVYCGDAEIISVENVFTLFTTSDKYDVQDLREKCVEFMKENLSVDTFCDTLILALQHSETELITSTKEFFAKNALDIAETVKWQSYSADNPTTSNELFIKALKAKDMKK